MTSFIYAIVQIYIEFFNLFVTGVIALAQFFLKVAIALYLIPKSDWLRHCAERNRNSLTDPGDRLTIFRDD